MFYRIKDDKVLDWADYNYSVDCLETDLISADEYQKEPYKMKIVWVNVTKQVEIKPPVYDEETGELIEEGEYETVIVTEQVEVEPPVYQLDEEGNIILDEDGNPIVIKEGIYETRNKQMQILALNPNYEQEKTQIEIERIAMLHITKQDFYKYICKPAGISYDVLKEKIIELNMQAEWELCNHVYYGVVKQFLSVLPLGKTEAEIIEIFEQIMQQAA